MRNFRAASAYLLLYLLPLFFLLEVASGYWIRRGGNALDVSRPILEANALLGWRQRPDLDTTFLGLPVKTNELGWRDIPLGAIPAKASRILVLGPSSTFGWGVRREDTYAASLERILDSRGSFSKVINAGEIGFSTEQGLRLLRTIDLGALHPEWVVIAYGVNDVDRFRFYFQSPDDDSEELSKPKSDTLIGFYRVAFSSSLVNVLLKTANGIRGRWGESAIAKAGAPRLRVAPSRFESNLRNLIAQARRHGARVIVVTSPSLLPSFPKAPEQALSSLAQSAVESGRFAEGLRLGSESLRIQSIQNEIHYYLSSAYAQLGDKGRAKDEFAKARETEPMRLERDIRFYNTLVRKVAQEMGTNLVDAEALAEEGKASDWFVDPIHPSPLGHGKIAERLALTIVSDSKTL